MQKREGGAGWKGGGRCGLVGRRTPETAGWAGLPTSAPHGTQTPSVFVSFGLIGFFSTLLFLVELEVCCFFIKNINEFLCYFKNITSSLVKNKCKLLFW